ncbi:MAG: VanW family protein [Candidatus Blackburnbacteria bacterium]|nr:VanW family protein [Candidatus Blackburnbacteria bacterium]
MLVVNKKTGQELDGRNQTIATPQGVLRLCFTCAKFLFILFSFLLLAYHLLFWGRIYPGVSTAGVNLGGKTKEQAHELLRDIKPAALVLTAEEKEFVFAPDALGLEYDTGDSVNEAYFLGRRQDLFTNTREKWAALTKKTNLPLLFKIDREALEEQIATVSSQVSVEPVEPSVEIQNKKAVVNPGREGYVLNREELKTRIFDSLSFRDESPIQIPLQKISPQLSLAEAEILRERAEKLVGKSLQIKFEFEVFSYPDGELVNFLTPEGFSQEKINSLVDSVAQGVERDPQDARFLFEGGRVKEFAPAKAGVTVKKAETEKEIENALERLLNTEEKTVSISLSVATTLPTLLTQDVNLLGIKELIGRGTSLFRGSIPGRVHNIALAASRLNGLLLKPGEVFSFNKALGDISVYTGYRQAYVIRDGRTVLGDGGGVCQVSTTFFRAALSAGLPVVERHAHSYRVGYYEQDSKPGVDATVYAPSVDLKVKNDTPAHMLIQAKADTQDMSLVFEFYGTKDGRVAEVSIPRVWDIRPAPPTRYQDDPTLPAGTLKQVDFAAVGAKAAFDYKVTRKNEVVFQKTFSSTYRPWQAVYLRGTAQ